MGLRLMETAAVGAALGPQPESILIAAKPGHGVPTGPLMRIAAMPLQLVNQDEGVERAVLHGVGFHLRKRGGPIRVGHRRNRCHGLRTCRDRYEVRHHAYDEDSDEVAQTPHTSTRTSLFMPAAM